MKNRVQFIEVEGRQVEVVRRAQRPGKAARDGAKDEAVALPIDERCASWAELGRKIISVEPIG